MANNPTKRQHVVSQALLNRFASSAGLIGAYDVRHGVTKLRTSKAVGFQENFVNHERDATEAIWKEVEDHVSSVFNDIDRQAGQLSEPTVRVVKDLVALHFARSLATSSGHAEALTGVEQALRNDKPRLARLARLKHEGLHLDHAPSVLTDIADEIIAGVRADEATGTIFRDDVVRYYEVTRAHFSAYSLMVRPVVTGTELLLGDCPAVSVSHGMQVSARSPLFEAALIAMPLGPRHVAFVYSHGIDEPVVPVGVEQALHLNGIQVAQAKRQVYFRPESGLNRMAQSYRPPIRRN